MDVELGGEVPVRTSPYPDAIRRQVLVSPLDCEGWENCVVLRIEFGCLDYALVVSRPVRGIVAKRRKKPMKIHVSST